MRNIVIASDMGLNRIERTVPLRADTTGSFVSVFAEGLDGEAAANPFKKFPSPNALQRKKLREVYSLPKQVPL